MEKNINNKTDIDKMRKRRNALIGALVIGTLFSIPFLARAYDFFGTGEEPKYEDVDLSLTDTGTGNPQFKELQKALDYVKEKPTDDGIIERINAYPNVWMINETPRNHFHIGAETVLRDVNYKPSNPLTTTLELIPVDLKDRAIFKDAIVIDGKNSGLEGIIKQNMPVGVQSGDTYVKDCYFEGIGTPLTISNQLTGNVEIRNNLMVGNGGGIGISLNGNESATTKFIGNTIYNFSYGAGSTDIALIFMGDATERGDNSFVANTKNLRVFKTPTTIPAQYNLWTSPRDEATSLVRVLTTEQEIRDTIEVITQTPTIITNTTIKNDTDIEVVPFLTHLPSLIVTKAKPTWRMYE